MNAVKFTEVEIKQLLLKFGEYLDAIDNVQEKNDAGFNRFDKSRWPAYKGHTLMMGKMLHKYRRQLAAKFANVEEVLKTVPLAPTVVCSQEGDRIYLRLNEMPKGVFDKYKDLVKSLGCYWDNNERSWFIPGKIFKEFNWKAFSDGMFEFGIELDRTKPAAISPGQYKRVNRLVIKRNVERKWIITYDYSQKLNDLFSNKKGLITGILEYDPQDHSRSTYSTDLIVEIVEKAKKTETGFQIEVVGLEEALKEQEAIKEMFRQQIPEVSAVIDPNLPLLPYQNEFVKFVCKNEQVLCGDETGLGKTVESLAFVAAFGHRVLVIVPKVGRRKWVTEAKKFFPKYFTDLNTMELTPKMKGKGLNLSGMKLVSVNYESLNKFLDEIKAADFDTIIGDESHLIKSEKTERFRTVDSIAHLFKYRILMSGTSIKNKKDELFTQIHIIRPGFFNSKDEIRNMTIGALWNKIQEFYIARQKKDVLKDMPPKLTSIINFDCDDAPDLSPNATIEEYSRMKVQVAVAKAPHTVDFIKGLITSTEASEDFESGILVFSDSREAAELICKSLGPDVAVLHHGQMSDDKREQIKDDFQSGKLKQRVLVSTRQSLAVNATLTRATKVVFNDLPWNAADVKQAEDRTHRVGQLSSVNVYWMVIENHYWDKKISTLVFKKYSLAKKVNEGKQLTKEERELMEQVIGTEGSL